MEYRTLGRTGKSISRLSFGAMRLPQVEIDGQWHIDQDLATPLMQRAVELGINYFDTAPFYCRDNSQASVGKALKSLRDKVMIATKIPLSAQHGVVNGSDYRRKLEESLTKMETDYVDVYQFWSFSYGGYQYALENGIVDAAYQAKAEGLIRHIGFSFHGNPESLAQLSGHPEFFETALVNHNLYDTTREAQLKIASKQGLGLINMGALSTPGLTESPEFREKALAQGFNPYQVALKFILQIPEFNSVLSSFKNLEVLEKTVEFVNQNPALSDAEWALIRGTEQHPTK